MEELIKSLLPHYSYLLQSRTMKSHYDNRKDSKNGMQEHDNNGTVIFQTKHPIPSADDVS